MLDKKYIKYTKRGIEERNVTTGQATLKTSSMFNNQARFSSSTINRYGSSSSRQSSEKRYSAKNRMANLATDRDGNGQTDDNTGTNAASQIYRKSVGGARLAINSVRGYSKARMTLSQIKSCGKISFSNPKIKEMTLRAVKNVRNNTALGAVDGISQNMQRSDESGLQAASSAVNAVRSGVRGVQTAKRSVKTARVTARVTKKVITHMASAVMSLSKKMLLKPLLAGGASAAGIIIPIVALFAIIGSIFGGSSSENAAPEMLEYIKQLDTDFIAEVYAKQEELSTEENKIEIIGIERVSTSPDELLALLSVKNDMDTELAERTKELLLQFHSHLNTFSVETFETTVTDENDKESTVEKTIIVVETYSVMQKMLSFGLDDDQIELLTEMLNVLPEISGGSSGGKKLSFPLKKYNYISSSYGQRLDPVSGEVTEYHTGMDISAPAGTAIYPAMEGVVTFSGVRGTYGNLIILKHRDGSETYYAHCDTLIASVGDSVTLSTQIATVGSTGRSTGPHLHLELRFNGRHTDPKPYL